jgi:hypothetical protein
MVEGLAASTHTTVIQVTPASAMAEVMAAAMVGEAMAVAVAGTDEVGPFIFRTTSFQLAHEV